MFQNMLLKMNSKIVGPTVVNFLNCKGGLRSHRIHNYLIRGKDEAISGVARPLAKNFDGFPITPNEYALFSRSAGVFLS